MSTKQWVDEVIRRAHEVIDEAIAVYRPSHIFAGFSGGHDSLCATYIASLHPRFSGCFHANTTIGIEQTRQFVRDTCAQFGWNLKEYLPPKNYKQIACEFGFPGPASHLWMYTQLKERQLRMLTREHKASHRDCIGIVTGVRHQESKRRMGYVVPINKEQARIWIAPIHDWTGVDKTEFMAAVGLPRNPVVDVLCMSGECLCGAFAKENELEEIRTFYPETAAEIERIQESVKRAGKKRCVWGWGGSRDRHKYDGRYEDPNQMALPLCWSCEAKADMLRNSRSR